MFSSLRIYRNSANLSCTFLFRSLFTLLLIAGRGWNFFFVEFDMVVSRRSELWPGYMNRKNSILLKKLSLFGFAFCLILELRRLKGT